MKNVLKLGLGLVLLFGGVLNAQQISGNISDETGPLPGASIVVQGTSTGAVADFDGNYSISADSANPIIKFDEVKKLLKI